jgi:hypothetical protein
MMEDLLGFILELLFEALFEIVLGALVAGAYRSLRHFRVTARRGSPALATAILIGVGLLLGFLSVLIFPHPLVHPSKLHGISLLISPLVTGLCMAAIGRGVRRRGRVPVKIETFGYGFAFAFAIALVRFLLAA